VLGALVFLSPYAGLVGCAALLPLAAALLAARRERRGRVALGLTPPPATRRLPRLLALVAVPALLALAATQPALRSSHSLPVRTDAQAMYVIDTSRSMLAASGPGGRTRFARAKADALTFRTALAQIPSGVATFTDRVLPSLLPDADPSVFDATVLHAVAINAPPPSTSGVVATSLDALGALGTGNYFPPSASKRLAVVFTDGESRAYDPRQVAHDLASGPGIKLILIHVWAPGERVYDQTRPELGYHEDPTSGQQLATLAAASGGAAFGEGSLQAAIARARLDLGSGPTHGVTQSEHTSSLAPYVALLALLPLLALVWIRGGRTSWRVAVRPELSADARRRAGGVSAALAARRRPAAPPPPLEQTPAPPRS
jgi:hypothetical protein